MSSRRDQQLMSARDLDEASTSLIRMGTRIVKKNPIKSSLYLVGVLLCLLVSGFTVSDTQRQDYDREFAKIDHENIARVGSEKEYSYNRYYRSKGWFSCDPACKENYDIYQQWQREYDALTQEERNIVATAKSKLGLFSEYGVEETRDLFWRRFAQGKAFAKRQSMFDMVFYGVGAMTRDESLLKYIIRLVTSVLINFTIGVTISVITFIFNLWSLISSYQASFVAGLAFFSLASLAAISFALSWIIGMYCVAAGTAFVGFTLAKNALLLEQGSDQDRGRIR